MKKYRIAVIVLLAGFALGAAACLFSFAYASVRGFSRQGRLERQSAYQRQEMEFLALRAEHGQWQRLPEELRRFRRVHIISMDDYAAFRRDLNLCLDDNGFPAPDISLQFGPVQGRMRRVSLRFTLSGPYRGLKKIVFDMERKPRMQFFEHIDLNAVGDKVSGTFSMEAYLGE